MSRARCFPSYFAAKTVKGLFLFSFFLCFIFSTARVPAWDGIGHMLVAAIAREHLNPDAKDKLDAIARKIDFPGRTYDSITMACWMDDIKTNEDDVPLHGQFKPWHYIDLGISPGDPQPSFEVTNPTDESSGNVVQALKRAVAVIKGGTDPLIPNPIVAYSMIVHLVGDIHQPLHCSTYVYSTPAADGKPDTDAGGNRVTITDSEASPGKMGPRKLNLHAFWDEAYRARFLGGEVVLDQTSYGQAHTDEDINSYRFDYAAYAPGPDVSLQTDFDAWARESNQLAKDDVYVQLTFDSAHRETDLSEDYVQKSNDLAKRRLVLAGYRLAKLLNDLLGDQPTTPVATGVLPSFAMATNAPSAVPAPYPPSAAPGAGSAAPASHPPSSAPITVAPGVPAPCPPPPVPTQNPAANSSAGLIPASGLPAASGTAPVPSPAPAVSPTAPPPGSTH